MNFNIFHKIRLKNCRSRDTFILKITFLQSQHRKNGLKEILKGVLNTGIAAVGLLAMVVLFALPELPEAPAEKLPLSPVEHSTIAPEGYAESMLLLRRSGSRELIRNLFQRQSDNSFRTLHPALEPSVLQVFQCPIRDWQESRTATVDKLLCLLRSTCIPVRAGPLAA